MVNSSFCKSVNFDNHLKDFVIFLVHCNLLFEIERINGFNEFFKKE